MSKVMKTMSVLTASIWGGFLFVAHFFVNMIIDMSMEGNTLAYPHIGYLVPSVFLSVILLFVTVINRKKDQLRRISICFFIFDITFSTAFFPVVPTVIYAADSYALAARVCYMANIVLPFSWLTAQ